MDTKTSAIAFVFHAAALCCILIAGCGGQNAAKSLEGEVSAGGQKPDGGTLRFVPVEGTPGPVHTAKIVDGRYRIESEAGMPFGKYRVEVDAKRKTGRKVMQFNGFENAPGDEYARIMPPQYAGEQSPLIAEINAASGGRFDVEITAAGGK